MTWIVKVLPIFTLMEMKIQTKSLLYNEKGELCFAPKMGKIGQKSEIWSLVFFGICSILKVYIICFVLGKSWFLRYEPVRLKDFQINYISRTNWWNSLIFYMMIQIHENKKLVKKSLDGHGQKWVLATLVTER